MPASLVVILAPASGPCCRMIPGVARHGDHDISGADRGFTVWWFLLEDYLITCALFFFLFLILGRSPSVSQGFCKVYLGYTDEILNTILGT